jgi:hypothetical protein
MRHFILEPAVFARPVAARTLRVFDPAATARLVTSPRFVQRPATRMGRTIGAVELASIAIAADEHLGPANRVRAQEKPILRHIIMATTATLIIRQPMTWTRAIVTAMMPLQSCPRTVKGTAPKQNFPVMDRRRACFPNSAGSYRANFRRP